MPYTYIRSQYPVDASAVEGILVLSHTAYFHLPCDPQPHGRVCLLPKGCRIAAVPVDIRFDVATSISSNVSCSRSSMLLKCARPFHRFLVVPSLKLSIALFKFFRATSGSELSSAEIANFRPFFVHCSIFMKFYSTFEIFGRPTRRASLSRRTCAHFLNASKSNRIIGSG